MTDIRDSERLAVKSTLAEVINGELRNGIVTGIYFTEFIMQ